MFIHPTPEARQAFRDLTGREMNLNGRRRGKMGFYDRNRIDQDKNRGAWVLFAVLVFWGLLEGVAQPPQTKIGRFLKFLLIFGLGCATTMLIFHWFGNPFEAPRKVKP